MHYVGHKLCHAHLVKHCARHGWKLLPQAIFAVGPKSCHARSRSWVPDPAIRALRLGRFTLWALNYVGRALLRAILPYALYPKGASFASSALRSWSCSGTKLHAMVTDPATWALRLRCFGLWSLGPAARNLRRGRSPAKRAPGSAPAINAPVRVLQILPHALFAIRTEPATCTFSKRLLQPQTTRALHRWQQNQTLSAPEREL
ncbi:unnamed protein product [Pieris macdunnoughi]|uniref:Uncharacterized protein n=1 Tax=Pieris macdunnoughi TaxID=345717 RepID=A0A821TDQ1_9NEOP|nr:unnamed protein product [Pieris macdunnoughi]